MEAVTFHGREYIKATSLALKYRYTPDYLGQLARAKKVDARLVGRAWYILEDSLLEHRGGKYKTVTEPEISDKKPNNNYLSRVAVEPYLKNKTARLVLGKNGSAATTRISYEEDEQTLIPTVKKPIAPSALRVTIADSEKVKITTENKRPTQFMAEELPDVALSGTLVIKDIADPEPEPEPVKAPVEPVPLQRKVVTVRPRREAPVVPRAKSMSPLMRPTPVKTTVSRPSFTPVTVVTAATQPSAPRSSMLVPLVSFVAAVAVSVLLLATTSETTATTTAYDSNWEVTFANILRLFP